MQQHQVNYRSAEVNNLKVGVWLQYFLILSFLYGSYHLLNFLSKIFFWLLTWCWKKNLLRDMEDVFWRIYCRWCNLTTLFTVILIYWFKLMVWNDFQGNWDRFENLIIFGNFFHVILWNLKKFVVLKMCAMKFSHVCCKILRNFILDRNIGTPYPRKYLLISLLPWLRWAKEHVSPLSCVGNVRNRLYPSKSYTRSEY